MTIKADSTSESSVHSPLQNGDINGPLSPTPQLKTPTFSVSSTVIILINLSLGISKETGFDWNLTLVNFCYIIKEMFHACFCNLKGQFSA